MPDAHFQYQALAEPVNSVFAAPAPSLIAASDSYIRTNSPWHMRQHAMDTVTFRAAITGNERGFEAPGSANYLHRTPPFAPARPSAPYVASPDVARDFSTPAAVINVAPVYPDATRRPVLAVGSMRTSIQPDQPVPTITAIAPSTGLSMIVTRYDFQYQALAAPLFVTQSQAAVGFAAVTPDQVPVLRNPRLRALLPQSVLDTLVQSVPVPGVAILVPIPYTGSHELMVYASGKSDLTSPEAMPTTPFGWQPQYPARVPVRPPLTRIEGLTFTNSGLIAPSNAWNSTYPDSTVRKSLHPSALPYAFKGESLEQFAPVLLWSAHYPDSVPVLHRQTRIDGLIFTHTGISIVVPDFAYAPVYPDTTRRASLGRQHYLAVSQSPSVESFPAVLLWLPEYPAATRRLRLPVAQLPSTESEHGASPSVVPAATGFWPVAPDATYRSFLSVRLMPVLSSGVSPEGNTVPANSWSPVMVGTTRRLSLPLPLHAFVVKSDFIPGQPVGGTDWYPVFPDRVLRAPQLLTGSVLFELWFPIRWPLIVRMTADGWVISLMAGAEFTQSTMSGDDYKDSD